MASKAGIVALLGAPNAGKSTLFNRLVGAPLAGITPKPQTTRFIIIGLCNHPMGQIVVWDTPGLIAQPKNAWHEALNRHSYTAAREADLLIYLFSLEEEQNRLFFPEWLATISKPILIGGTHGDALPEAKRQERLSRLSDATASLPVKGIYDVSVDRPLEKFIEAILEYLAEGSPLYPTEEITPQSMRFFVAEVLRKQLYLHLHEELPYGAEVEVTSYRELPEKDYIQATIYVEKESHKPMVIGKGGAMIKAIGMAARKEIELLSGKPAYLELYVKVAPNWRKSIQRLKGWGYKVK